MNYECRFLIGLIEQEVICSAKVPSHQLDFQSAHGNSGAENLLIQGELKVPCRSTADRSSAPRPVYNAQSTFAHYDDKLEHSQWLSMMYPLLGLLRDLLAPDGSIANDDYREEAQAGRRGANYRSPQGRDLQTLGDAEGPDETLILSLLQGISA